MREHSSRNDSLRIRTVALFGASVVVCLLAATPALAAFQQVENFAGVPGLLKKTLEYEDFPEEVQLGGLGGMAVNYTGAGGVPAGTIYAAGKAGSYYVARYGPDKSFSERWEVLSKKEEEAREAKAEVPYRRCGPDGAPTELTCKPHPSSSGPTTDVDVDQTTGNLYVYAGFEDSGAPRITEYSPDGSEVIARFGEAVPSFQPTLSSPEKVHGTSGVGPLAVNAAGEVFLMDLNYFDNFYHRLMVFKPKTPGDYTEYEYAGQSRDLAAGFIFVTNYPAMPVTDAAGNVYVAGDDTVERYDPAHPGDPATCKFVFKKGGISSLTVNPLTGEAAFYAYQDHKVHLLSPCAAGKFTEVEAIVTTPKRTELTGMAIDPVTQFGPGRPTGVLYAGAPTGEEGETKGSGSDRESESSMGYVLAPPVEAPPVIVSEAASSVTQSSVRLEGKVNPEGFPTRYAFQYIADAAYQANAPADRFAGAGEAPASGGRLEGSETLPVAAAVGGLRAGTGYHYRIVAVSHCAAATPSKECVAAGAEQTFSTYRPEAPGLPDHRAYELVSPVQKNGGQVIPANPSAGSCASHVCKPGSSYYSFPKQSSPDGEAIVYEGNPFSFDEGALIEDEYISRRTDAGWQSVNLSPARMTSGERSGYQAFSTELGVGAFAQLAGAPLSPEAPAAYVNIYTQSSYARDSLTPLLKQAPPNRSTTIPSDRLGLEFGGASADLSRIFFSANDALTANAQGGAEGKQNLYESSGGTLSLVNVAPGNATTLPGAALGSGKLLESGGSNSPNPVVLHAVSDDGSRVFWTAEEDGHLYLRESGQTLQIPDPGSCTVSVPLSQRVCFLTAAADGSSVLFSNGLLFDFADLGSPLDLSQGNGGFQGVVGQSEDLSRIYFSDTKVLTGEEQNEYGDKAVDGKSNLYAWVQGVT